MRLLVIFVPGKSASFHRHQFPLLPGKGKRTCTLKNVLLVDARLSVCTPDNSEMLDAAGYGTPIAKIPMLRCIYK